MTDQIIIIIIFIADPYYALRKYIATRDPIHLFDSSFYYVYKFLIGQLAGGNERRKFLQAIMKWGLNTSNEWSGWMPIRVAQYCISYQTLALMLPYSSPPTWTTTQQPKTLDDVAANVHIPPPPPTPPMVDFSTSKNKRSKNPLNNRQRLQSIQQRIKMAKR